MKKKTHDRLHLCMQVQSKAYLIKQYGRIMTGRGRDKMFLIHVRVVNEMLEDLQDACLYLYYTTNAICANLQGVMY